MVFMDSGDVKFIELFAGIGGFRYGLERANNTQYACIGQKPKQEKCEQGRKRTTDEQKIQLCNRNQSTFRCVWANEIDKYACQIYRKNFGKGELYEGDITKYAADDIPDHDLLTGGFPCQAFSIAGKRKGFEDARGTLFFDIARILDTKRPRMLLLENVKGLLSHDNGNTFRTILWILHDLGYDVQWQVLDSKNWVPQSRTRVFIIGHFRGTPRPEIFPLRESQEVFNEGSRQGLAQNQYSTAITSNYRKGVHSGGETYIEVPKINVAGYLNDNGWEKRHESIRRVYDPEGVAPTMPTGTGGGVMTKIQLKDMQIRRLTPLECERLQGFPDGWTEGLSDTQRYKCIGNAVTTNVITEIGRRLLLEWNSQRKK